MTSSPRVLARTLLLTFRSRWRALLTYHLFFVMLAVTLLTPVISFLLTQWLDSSGQPAISNEDLYSFAFSFAGLTWALLAGTLIMTLAFIQVSGLLLVMEVHGRNRYQAVTSALVATFRLLPRLIGLALTQVATHLAAALPFLLAVAALGYWLLMDFDPYFLMSHWPVEKQWFVALASPLLLAMAVCNGSLYLRWILALPIMVFERRSVLASLIASHALTRQYRLPIAATLLGVAAITVSLPLTFALVYRPFASIVLNLAGNSMQLAVATAVFLAALYLVINILLTFVMIVLNGLVIRYLYLRARGIRATRMPPPTRRLSGVLAWGTECLLLVFAQGQSAWLVQSFFNTQDSVAITAHRGSSINAPENTLAAIELAIEEGADYVEFDVRQTADGELVLVHDRDFRRLGGPATPIWNMTFDEVQAVDVGRWFGPDFAGERVPTLDDVIDQVGDRATLYVEIKPGPDPLGLTEAIVDRLTERDALDNSLLAALDRRLLDHARDRQPDLRTALFVHTVIGQTDYSTLDAVGFRAATLNRAQIRQSHQQDFEVHVWTVNDPNEMARFIDLGVDNIITDRPDLLAELLDARTDLSDAERLILRVSRWLQAR